MGKYWHAPVAKEIDVAHGVNCPSVFSGSVVVAPGLVIVRCKTPCYKDKNKSLGAIYFVRFL